MKKIFLFVLSLLTVSAIIAQGVPREMVVLEIGTGTWCQYCPGAAMGADDLLENGKRVAVVENHGGSGPDPYKNVYSLARNTMYAVPGYPTAAFDGIESLVGGNHTQSMYGNYLPKYNNCIALTSPVEMTMAVEETDGDYNVTIQMTKVDTFSATNIVLYFFVTQSNIQYNWQGQTHLEHVNQLMVPDQNGTSVSFASGDVQTVDLSFTMDAALPVEDCEFIAILQNKTPGQGNIPGPYPVKRWQVYQTIKRGVIDLTPGFTASATQVDKYSQVTFTNETSGGYIGVPETYEWHFPGANPETSTVKNPTTFYTDCGAHDVTLIVDRGGQVETLVKEMYIMVGPSGNINSSPSDTTCWYQPITLDATDPIADSYLWEPGGATTPSITVDAGNLGLGAHTFTVTVTSAGGCESTGTHTIFFDECLGVNDQPGTINASVYPNPSNGNFMLELNAPRKSTVDIQVVNTLGTSVYEEKGIQVNGKLLKNFNLNLNNGIYFVVIRTGSEKTIQKLLITR
ncbi:MAG: T9SS C-terminal target domain-containing protein [Bacteroidetes bacterium]|nr:MAG: T9SS C-terminal target domain-containing protein [Bacteroidota bacterium]